MRNALAILLLLFLPTGFVPLANAQVPPRIVTCASFEFRDQYCPADTRGGVRLWRQISRTACEEGVTWGYDRRGIWVTEGCEGEFALAPDDSRRGARWRDRYDERDRRYDDARGRAVPPPYEARGYERRHGPRDRGGETVVCESLDFRYRHCAARVRDHVDLVEQLSKSECRYGQTWGYDRGGVWVDRGCAAAFAVN